jgi:hypothetical protein
MTFEEVLDQAMAMLQRRGRLTYRTLKLHFQLDDEHLEALEDEMIYGQRLAADEDGRVLVWTGGADVPSSTTSAGPQPAQPPGGQAAHAPRPSPGGRGRNRARVLVKGRYAPVSRACKAWRTFSAVTGRSVMLTPTASNTALTIAGATAPIGCSPMDLPP